MTEENYSVFFSGAPKNWVQNWCLEVQIWGLEWLCAALGRFSVPRRFPDVSQAFPRRLLETSWAPSWGEVGGQKATRGSFEASLGAFSSVLYTCWWNFSNFQSQRASVSLFLLEIFETRKPSISLMDFEVRRRFWSTHHICIDHGGSQRPLEASWRPRGVF